MKKIKNKRLIIKLTIIIVLIVCWFYENKHIDVSTYTYESEKIDEELEDFKIVQVSDLHNSVFGINNKKLLDKIKSCSPDIIVVTGDLPDSFLEKTNYSIAFLKEAVKICPVYYITGNHEYNLSTEDYNLLKKEIENIGVIDIDDDKRIIEVGDSSFVLAGLDDRSLIGDTLSTLLEDYEGLKIVLCHEPDFFDKYEKAGADLILAGHAHGGLIRIPFVGGIIAPGQGFFPEYTKGEYYINDSEMIVSGGLGNSVVPLRLFNHPEIVCVEFLHEYHER